MRFSLLVVATLIAAFAAGSAIAKESKPFFGDSKTALTGNLKTAALVKGPPAALKKKLPKGSSVYSIDLDSDGKPDYIVQSPGKTCFVDSRLTERSCRKSGDYGGFVYYYFAQLDDDPMLEVFEFEGDEDSSNYKILKFDPMTWKLTVLTKFHPLLRPVDKEHKGLFWGYPWDITDLPLNNEDAQLRLGAIARLDVEDEPAPAIFFEGVPTQGDPHGTVNEYLAKEKFLTLDELVRGLRKPAK